MVRVQKAQSDRYCRGKAKVCMLDFKTTWSESQKVSQTATEQSKGEQCIFNFRTTWSEFHKASQTTAERGNAELRILNFKTTWSEFQKPSQTATGGGKVELCLLNFKTTCSELLPSYKYTIFKKHHLPRVSPKQLCASAHLGSTRAAGTS